MSLTPDHYGLAAQSFHEYLVGSRVEIIQLKGLVATSAQEPDPIYYSPEFVPSDYFNGS